MPWRWVDCRFCQPAAAWSCGCLSTDLASVPLCRCLQGKGCGFVQFVLRTAAERAMAAMNGQVLGASAMRISWGRSSSRVANQAQQQGGMGAPHFGAMHGECCTWATRRCVRTSLCHAQGF